MIERPVFENSGANSLAVIVESAAEFGLSHREIWETIVATADRLPEDTRTIYVDELSGALARCLVEKERLAAQKDGRAAPNGLRSR
jgi:hypothetical protein